MNPPLRTKGGAPEEAGDAGLKPGATLKARTHPPERRKNPRITRFRTKRGGGMLDGYSAERTLLQNARSQQDERRL